MQKNVRYNGMRISIIIAAVLLLAGIYVRIAGAVPMEEWHRTFGGVGSDGALSVQQTLDGGYILTGWTESYGAGQTYPYGPGSSDAWLIKTDIRGNELWNKTFGGKYPDMARSVQQTLDGGYILAGWTESYGPGSSDAWLIKTDANGNEQWSKIFGYAAEDEASSVQQTLDGGYILAGNTNSIGMGDYDALLIKSNAMGEMQWGNLFGGTGSDRVRSVQQTSEGGYILAGDTNSFGVGGYDAWLIKTDASGKEQWSKTFGGIGGDWADSVRQTSDGGYILAGSTNSSEADDRDAWLIKTDASGNEQWSKTFGGKYSDMASSVQQTSDGGYILAGRYSYGFFGDAWLIKTDASGNEKWSKTLCCSYRISSVQQTSDDGYILAGEFFTSYNKNDALLVKLRESRSYTFHTTDNAMQITVDGAPHSSPYTVNWFDGTTHSVSVPSSQAILPDQSQYVFTSWSGMSTSTSPSIPITSGAATAGAYTANYKTQHYLTVNTEPAGLTTISGSGWYDSGVTAATGTAPALVGANMFSTWKVDGSPVSGNPIPVSMNAPHTATAVYDLDNIPPATTATISGSTGNNGWNTSDVKIALSAIDNLGGSGVKKTEYSFDNVGWNTYTAQFTISDEGTKNVYYRSIDNAGNTEAAKTGTVKIDKTAPEISGSPTASPNSNGWYNSSVVVHFTASDSVSGVDSVTPDTTLSENASSQYVNGTATDKAGNSASFNVTGINIDMIPPIITGAPTTSPNSNGWYNSSVVVHFSASDTISGIDSVTPDTTLSENASSQSVTGTVIDRAGNSNSTIVSGINIDMISPGTNISLSGTSGNNGWYVSKNVTVILIPTESGSGIAKIETSSNGINWNIYTAPFNITMQGETKVYYRSIDNAGNSEDPKNQTVKIDWTRPNLNTNPVVRDATNSSGAVVDYVAQGNVTASDSHSGLLLLACIPPPGLFPLGTTAVNCKAEDIAGNSRSGSFNVTIKDGTPPNTSILTVVDGNGMNITSDTLNTTVNFTFSGTDYIGSDIVLDPLNFKCRHFENQIPFGIFKPCTSPWNYSNLTTGVFHTIEVYAIDNSGNRDLSPANFTWFILTPVQGGQALVDIIENMNLPAGETTSLTATVKESIPLLADSNPTNDVAVCGKMTSLIEKVDAREKTHRLTALQARQIRLPAKDIKIGVGCQSSGRP